MAPTTGFEGLLQISVTLGMIMITWRMLRNAKMEQLFQVPSPMEARILRLFIAILIGHGISRFLFDYLIWTSMLKYIGATGQ